ncbi:MAG: preprotein translocase subunit SecE [Bdellovibrionales bacterium]|nr:preprotein translocase subunit SecE [Bdellovibrionales bacterium]
MTNDRKWIYLSYLILTVLFGWVLNHAIATVFDIVAYPNRRVLEVAPLSAVISAGVAGLFGFFYFRREKIQSFSLEVMQELKKVTWPIKKTAYISTVVVLVLVVICAVCLGVFDVVANWFIGTVLSA